MQIVGRNKFGFSKWAVLILILLAIYPAAVLGYVWYYCAISNLKGGSSGPLDAYRHTLASAVVAYTLSPKAVTIVSYVMERKAKPANLMDVHNNAIGAAIGNRVTKFSEIEPLVRQQIAGGKVNAGNFLQTTWMPLKKWRKSTFW